MCGAAHWMGVFSMMVSYGPAARYGSETARSWLLDPSYPNPAAGPGTVVLNGLLGVAWVKDPSGETVHVTLNLQ